MKEARELYELVEEFVDRVSSTRGLTASLAADAALTLHQVALLSYVWTLDTCTPSRLAKAMKLSLPAASRMIDRLVRLRLAQRLDDPSDRRRRVVKVTPRALTLLRELRDEQSLDFTHYTAALSATTRTRLAEVLTQVLGELAEPPRAERERAPAQRRAWLALRPLAWR